MAEALELATTLALVRAEVRRLGADTFKFADGEAGTGIADIRDDGPRFHIDLTDGSTVTLPKPQPVQYMPPVGIETTRIDARGHLLVSLTNGLVQDLGRVRGKDGEDGANAVGIRSVGMEAGCLVIRLSDGTRYKSPRIMGRDGEDAKGKKGDQGPRGYSFHVLDQKPLDDFGQNGDSALVLADSSIYKKRGGLWKRERADVFAGPRRGGGGIGEKRVLELIKANTNMQFDDYSDTDDVKLTGTGSEQALTFKAPVQMVVISLIGEDGEAGFIELDGDTAAEGAGQVLFSNQQNYYPTPKERATYSVWLPAGMQAYATGYIR